MCWYWQYAGLIAVSTAVDYWVGQHLHKESEPKRRRFYLLISLGVNLGILAVFKYFNFFSELSATTFNLFGLSIEPQVHQLLLPVGISFYTFQTLSYTLDIYRKELEPEKKFVKFAVFVSFFPQLVAGPIVRAKSFLPQINQIRTPTYVNLNLGMFLIILGLVKKIFIADLLAFLAVDRIFDSPGLFSSVDLMMGLYAYSFQIYCDFSGYSDIAIGVALLLGFNLPINFNRPYLSQGPSEFWRRWHISLSTWLRDYLYISLGGNRGSRYKVTRNLILTMLLGGLWHGAALNFVIWGLFHGVLLVLFRGFKGEQSFNYRMVINIVVFYHVTLIGWLIFRLPDMQVFTAYVKGLFNFSGGSQLSVLFYMILVVAALMHFVPKNFIKEHISREFMRMSVVVKAVVCSGAILVLTGLALSEPNFIYFQF